MLDSVMFISGVILAVAGLVCMVLAVSKNQWPEAIFWLLFAQYMKKLAFGD